MNIQKSFFVEHILYVATGFSIFIATPLFFGIRKYIDHFEEKKATKKDRREKTTPTASPHPLDHHSQQPRKHNKGCRSDRRAFR